MITTIKLTIIIRVDPLQDFDWTRLQSGKLWNGMVGRDARGRLHGKCRIHFQVIIIIIVIIVIVIIIIENSSILVNTGII